MGNVNKKLLCSKQMPKLKHKQNDEKFNVYKSEVIQWLIQQPDILNYIFDKVNNLSLITYNPVTNTWQGVDYED